MFVPIFPYRALVFEEFVMLLSWKAVTLHFYFWFIPIGIMV